MKYKNFKNIKDFIAYEPDGEVETTNGFVDIYSIYEVIEF